MENNDATRSVEVPSPTEGRRSARAEPVRPAGDIVKPHDVAIVVLNWNRAAETISCLEALHQAQLGGASVIVVDNGSHDGSVEAVQDRFPTQTILTLVENQGYAGGNNAGMRAALDTGAKAVLLLNNDTRVAPDFLAPLLAVLNSTPKVGAISSAILKMEHPDLLDVAYLDIYFGHGIVHRRGVNANPAQGFDKCRDVEVAIGCSLLLTAEALVTVGLLDESYFAYHEEVDWCFRARKAGFRIIYQPESRVWHGGSKSTRSLRVGEELDRTLPGRVQLPNAIPLSWNPVRSYLGARNAVRFIRTHGTLQLKAYYAASTLYAVPLEILAVVMRREEDLMLGLWSYRRAMSLYCIPRDASEPPPKPTLFQAITERLHVLVRLPAALLSRLPRDIRRAHREGRLDQLVEHVRGLWDGVLNRPLPLKRLRLHHTPVRSEKVTIIVLNWNQGEETVACLRSLAEADLGGASILVVDNGSRDGSVDTIRAHFPNVRILALPENRGYAGGNNAGIRVALENGAQGVLLLNNDTRVAPDFLHALLWALYDGPEAAAVSSAILRLDRPEMMDVAYTEVRFSQRDAVRIRGVNALPGEGFDSRREVDAAIGCSLLLRAEALRKVGLLDESYFAYHEDVDWCLRARKAGFQILFEPYSRVFHRGSSSTDTDQRPTAQSIGTEHPALPNAEPMPWNPVRTYLGARNLIRLLRSHATILQQCAFFCSCVYEIPLEFFAVILDREGWMRLHRWSYLDVVRVHFIERHDALRDDRRGILPIMRKAAALLVLLPIDLFWTLPREVRRAVREGRLAQFREYIRGLWDGVLDRPLPLQRLGLR